jgi:NAD(P)-dependent dehydrogenase (short-subunit alcohol dehydrogenase family)
MDTKLDGRVVIVTGAAQGIGQVYARRLVAEGALVVISMSGNWEPPQDAREIVRVRGSREPLILSLSKGGRRFGAFRRRLVTATRCNRPPS